MQTYGVTVYSVETKYKVTGTHLRKDHWMKRWRKTILISLLVMTTIAVIAWLILRTQLTVEHGEALARGELLVQRSRVLAIVAHPDDADWWISGTLRRLVIQGAEVALIVASDGEKGRNLTGAENLASKRIEEQMEAARIIGYETVHFLHLPDRGVTRDKELSADIRDIWEEFKPDAIITFDPDRPAMPYLHPDHESLGDVVRELWRTYTDRLPLYYFHTRRPDTGVEITSVIDTKLKALRAHLSQGLDSGGDRNRDYHRNTGKLVGVEYAELFRRIE